MKTRKPAFAGQFYPKDNLDLTNMIKTLLSKEKERINYSLSSNKILGGIVPHAGYQYSGYQAVHFFEILAHSKQKYDTVFIIFPNHTGIGAYISTDENEVWRSPAGDVYLDKDFIKELNYPENSGAHAYEHSGEVILPFMQHFFKFDFQIVPICMFHQNAGNAKMLAQAIYDANKKLGKSILIIASSDFSHQVKPEYGYMMDQMVIDEIIRLNTEGVFKNIVQHDISVCGYGPIMTLIEYVKLVSNNIKTVELRRGNSGEVYPSQKVVDYVSMLFYEEVT